MSTDQPDQETIPGDELARFRRIEEAAQKLLIVMEGRRSATNVLTAVAELRQALRPA